MIAETPARFVCPEGHHRVINRRRVIGRFYWDAETGDAVFATIEDTEGEIYFREFPAPHSDEQTMPRREFERRYRRDD